MNIVHVLEAGMLVCFGISWPFNIAKSIRSRTAKGKSVAFELLIIAGYLCGLVGKLILGNLSYVVFFYIADILMVAARPRPDAPQPPSRPRTRQYINMLRLSARSVVHKPYIRVMGRYALECTK